MSSDSTSKARMLAGSEKDKLDLFVFLIDKVVSREDLSDEELGYLEFLKSYFLVAE